MSTMMRAQVGLIFQDEDMFNNFIEPYKQSRELNGLIMKCLTAYYYDENARNIIEGINPAEVGIDSSDISNQQDTINAVRQSLMMQDYLMSELQDTIDEGSDDINGILNKTNDLAKNSGVAKPSKSDFGEGLLKLESHSGATPKSDTPTDEKEFMHIMFMAMMKMAQDLGNSEVVNILQGGGNTGMQPMIGSGVSDSPNVKIETAENIANMNDIAPVVQEPLQKVPEPVIEQPVIPQVQQAVVEKEVNITPKANDTAVNISESNDATSAIADLLGSM